MWLRWFVFYCFVKKKALMIFELDVDDVVSYFFKHWPCIVLNFLRVRNSLYFIFARWLLLPLIVLLLLLMWQNHKQVSVGLFCFHFPSSRLDCRRNIKERRFLSFWWSREKGNDKKRKIEKRVEDKRARRWKRGDGRVQFHVHVSSLYNCLEACCRPKKKNNRKKESEKKKVEISIGKMGKDCFMMCGTHFFLLTSFLSFDTFLY